MKVINLTSKCNNSCIFCSSSNADLSVERSLDLSNVDDDCIVTGGEPTLHPQFFQIISMLSKNNLVIVETNGRAFSLSSYLSQLKHLVNRRIIFDILVVGHIQELHDYITRTDSFFQTLKGIKNLFSLGFEIRTHTVVVKPNYRYLPKIARLISKYSSNHRFIFVQPLGNAMKYFDSVVPFFSMVEPYLISAVNFLESRGIGVSLENFVPCVAGGRQDLITKYSNSIKLPLCENCKFNCPGAPKWYVNKKSDDDFRA